MSEILDINDVIKHFNFMHTILKLGNYKLVRNYNKVLYFENNHGHIIELHKCVKYPGTEDVHILFYVIRNKLLTKLGLSIKVSKEVYYAYFNLMNDGFINNNKTCVTKNFKLVKMPELIKSIKSKNSYKALITDLLNPNNTLVKNTSEHYKITDTSDYYYLINKYGAIEVIEFISHNINKEYVIRRRGYRSIKINEAVKELFYQGILLEVK